jgi:iron complex transport system ATP-binding protein
MSKFLTITDLNFSYYKKNKVLNSLNMEVSKGERIGILGSNGCGKTTLVRILSGVLRNYKGRILINNKDLKEYSYRDLSKIVAVVPQNFSIPLEYKVQDIILMGRFPYTSTFRGFSKSDYDIVERIIDELDLHGIRNKSFSKISGGEAQRVVIAKALAQEPEILILDEFAAHLDLNHKKNLMDIINNLQDITLIGVYHDINLSINMVNKIYFIKEGEILYSGSIENMINKDIIREVYNVDVNILVDKFGKKRIFL